MPGLVAQSMNTQHQNRFDPTSEQVLRRALADIGIEVKTRDELYAATHAMAVLMRAVVETVQRPDTPHPDPE